MTPETTGRGIKPSHGALTEKARGLGLGDEELQRLAIQRGCSYYDDGTPSRPVPILVEEFSNEELAVALLSASAARSPRMMRLAAAMLGSEGLDARLVGKLARDTGTTALTAYIARCGMKFEPNNPFWEDLLTSLPSGQPVPEGLPHPTRFVEMTGMIRGRVGTFTSWIRPRPKAVA